MAVPAALAEIPGLSRLVRRGDAPAEEAFEARSLGLDPLGWGSELDAALPDGGLPRGAVVEVASALGLARATSFAVAACASAQRELASWGAPAAIKASMPSEPERAPPGGEEGLVGGLREAFPREQVVSGARKAVPGAEQTVSEAIPGPKQAVQGAGAWCAWIDPWGTLHAPGLLAAGLELERLLVVRPPLPALARAALRVAASGVFAVVVVDTVAPLGGSLLGGSLREGVRLDRWSTVVRRLALAIEGSETTVLLLTDLAAHRGLPLPVAMRLELDHQVELTVGERSLASRAYLRVAKDRHGRVGGRVPVRMAR